MEMKRLNDIKRALSSPKGLVRRYTNRAEMLDRMEGQLKGIKRALTGPEGLARGLASHAKKLERLDTRVSDIARALSGAEGLVGKLRDQSQALEGFDAQLKRSEKLANKLAATLKHAPAALPVKQCLPGWSPAYLARLGPVGTVIDVGVLEGTPALYKAFPDAYLVLVEALPKYETRCRELIADRTGEVAMVAASDEDGETTIRYYPDYPAVSSLVETAQPVDRKLEELTVPMRRLDGLFADRKDLPGPILLKVDTEGLEDRVVRGATKLLSRVSYCITETSVKERHKNSYRFADLIALMREQNFELFDIMTATRAQRGDPGASIVDAVFVNTALAPT